MSQNQYKKVFDEVADAARKSGRHPNEVLLLAVTKSMNVQQIKDLYDQGQRTFGEGRCQEAFEKQAVMPDDCFWHLIGTLQSKKIPKVLGKFALIHSVDSIELARKVSLASQTAGIVTSILLQVNVSGELSKHGLSPEDWKMSLEDILHLPSLSIEGLMTMAPHHAEEKEARSCFSGLRQLQEELRLQSGNKLFLPHLSMGMSNDFKWAIAEGSTIVRIGSALNP